MTCTAEAASGRGNDTSISSGRAWYAVGVLLVAYIFSIMDRQILTLLVDPIQQSLGVNDTLIGLLHGFTFAAFYAVAGLPIARVIDRGDRRWIIAIGIAIWSVATAAGGLAGEYWHLLLARIAVAVGEAVLLPGAVSLLADLFSGSERGRAMGVFGAAGPLGSGIGLIAGGLLLAAYTASQPVLPLLGAIEPWRATFIAVGLPGVIVAAVMLTIPEPRKRKRGANPVATATAPEVPVAAVLTYLGANARTVVSLFVGAGFFYTGVYAWAGWAPTFFVREFGWTYPQIGKVFGLALAITGPAGALFGTWLGDRWRRKGIAHGYLRVALTAAIGLTTVASAMVLAPGADLAVIFLVLSAGFSFFLFGAGPAAIAQIAPGRIRAQLTALYTGGLNLIGAGLGPVAVGALTDYVLDDPKAIKFSMLAIFVASGVVAIVLFRSGVRGYRRTLDNAAAWEAAIELPPNAAAATNASR
ncbi:MFS transporter [Lysobacter sp. TAF61]|uniref:MFS transporter n=1 Tax=Lysobacter sp. TAF61 TaxID=3233072 RepID=UPI003F9AB235